MLFEWVKWKNHEECIGATNIGTGFIFAEFRFPISFSFLSYRYDGLPIRGIHIGFVYIGWGVTHHWED